MHVIHRRLDFRKRTAILSVLGFVALAVLVLGPGWDVRLVILALLVLPGLIYLLLERLQLTPKPMQAGPLP